MDRLEYRRSLGLPNLGLDEKTSRLDNWNNPIECPYCGQTEGLRVACDGGGYIATDYICAACFTGQEDGPCFDDLPEPALT